MALFDRFRIQIAPSSSTPRKARLSTLQLQGGEDACGGVGKKDAAARTEKSDGGLLRAT